MQKQGLLFSQKLTSILLILFLYFTIPGMAQTLDAAREKIMIIQERAEQDKNRALDLKSKAEIQIQNAQTILEKAKSNPNDPSLKNREQVIARAPGALQYGQKVLAKAEKSIQEADLKIEWSKRALKNLGEPTGNSKKSIGGAMPINYPKQGEVQIETFEGNTLKYRPFDEKGILPGDRIVTGKDGKVQLLGLYSLGHTVTVGPETSIELAKDNSDGTVWNLYTGKVHSAPLYDNENTPPRISTPKGIVEAEPGSEFDVIVGEQGETTLVPYKGNVKLVDQENTDLFSEISKRTVFENTEMSEEKPAEKAWWE